MAKECDVVAVGQRYNLSFLVPVSAFVLFLPTLSMSASNLSRVIFERKCDVNDEGISRSPDKLSELRWFVRGCDAGLFTDFTTQVWLGSQTRPEFRHILVFEDNGDTDPRVDWNSNDSATITITRLAHVSSSLKLMAGFSINYIVDQSVHVEIDKIVETTRKSIKYYQSDTTLSVRDRQETIKENFDILDMIEEFRAWEFKYAN